MARTTSQTLRRRQADVQEFLSALQSLLHVCAPTQGNITGQPQWQPISGHEQEAGRLAGQVDVVSGKAAHALASVPVWIDWKPRGTWETTPISPASAWRTIFDWDPMFGPDMIFAMCNQAIGVIDLRGTEAEEHERSIEGRLSHVVGFSARVRGHDGSRRFKQAPGMIATFVVGIAVAFVAFKLGWGGG